MSTEFNTTFDDWNKRYSFPFVLGDVAGLRLYRDVRWAIVIESCVVDSKPIHAVEFTGRFDDLDFSAIDVEMSGPFVYQFPRGDLIYARKLEVTENDAKFEMEKIELPESAKKIEFNYRIRTIGKPVGKESLSLKVFAND